MKVPDRTFERALGTSPAALAESAEAAIRIPADLQATAPGQPQPVFNSFSEQIPAGRRADRKREMVTCRRRYEILPAGCDWSLPERAPLENLAHANVVYHSHATAVPLCEISAGKNTERTFAG